MTPQECLTLTIRRAVTKDIGLASILLYVPAMVISDPDCIARTDGVRMFFSDRYFDYSPEEQSALVIHEALHVALRHVQRGRALKLREGGDYDARRWNIACDAVINQSLRSCRWCKLPKAAWYPEHCLMGAQLRERAAELWTAEEIYLQSPRKEGEKGKFLRTADEFLAGDLIDTDNVCALSGAVHEQHMEDGTWRERLVRAQAGSAPRSILRRLSADIPRPAVRWQSVLRDFMVARLMPITESSWSRLARRTLALGDAALFLEPGVDRQRGIRRAGIVIDTSGSVDDDMLRAFLAEINSLMVTTGCEVVLIDCDAEVQQVSLHRTPIRDYVAKGGGGTDFRPALAALAKVRLDIAVYFTDLLGTFPEKAPSIPLLWAVTNDLSVPFGRKLLLPNRGGL